MRLMLDTVSMSVVVIGGGEGQAPMLYSREEVGDGNGPGVDVAVDPLEARGWPSGMPNAIAVIARRAWDDVRGCMNKIAVGPGGDASTSTRPRRTTSGGSPRRKGCTRRTSASSCSTATATSS